MSAVVERLLDQGVIKESQVQEMEEFHDFIKESGFFTDAMKKVKPFAVDFGKSLLAALPAAGIVVGGTHLAGRLDNKNKQGRLNQSLNLVMSSNNALMKDDRTKGTFHQIASIAPNVAQNPLIMSKVLPEAVRNGLNVGGISNLVAMEKNLVLGRQAGANPSIGGNLVRKVTPLVAQSAGEGIADYIHSLGAPEVESQGSETETETENKSNNEINSGKSLSGSIFPNSDSTSEPIDKSKEFQYYYMAAKKAGILPKEVSSINPDDPNAVLRFTAWADKNERSVHAMAKKLLKTYRDKDGYLKAGRDAYNARYGTEKKAEFIGEILADALFLKTASKGKTAVSIGNALKGLLAASAIGAGFGIVEEAADYSRNKVRQEKLVDSWGKAQEILKKMPDNVKTWNGTKENLQKAKGAFNAMISVAPDLAVNPVIAASFINTTLNNQGLVDSNSLKALTDSQKNYTASNNYTSPFAKSPFFSGATAGFSAGGGKKLIDAVATSVGKSE